MDHRGRQTDAKPRRFGEPLVSRRTVLTTGGVVVSSLLARPAAGQTSTDQAWPQYGTDSSNTATVEEQAGVRADPARQWELDIKTPVRSGIVSAGDSIFTFGSNGDLYAVDSSQNVRTFAVGAAPNGVSHDKRSRTALPAIDDGALYLGGLDGSLYAIDIESRSQIWSKPVGNPIRASPVVAGGSITVVATNGTVASVDPVSGDEQWSHGIEGRVVATPAVAGGTVFVGAESGSVTALDADTGEKVWTFDAGAAVTAALTLGESRVFVATEDGTVYALSRKSGKPDWDATVPAAVLASPSLSSETLYVADSRGTVAAVDAATGNRQWEGDAGDTVVGDPAATADVIYTPTESGSIVALGREDGSRLWSIDAGGAIVTPLTALHGRVYAGTLDGTVVAIEQDSGLVSTALSYGETAIEAVKQNSLIAGGATGTMLAAFGGYTAVKRLGGRSDESETDRSRPATRATSETSAIADLPATESDQLDLSGVSYDDFETGELIGSGGSADVHRTRVQQEGRERTVALKTPRMADYETVDRSFFEEFAQEAEVWNGIDDHEAIVSVLAWGEQPVPWIALEYMDGGNLDERMAELETDTALAHLERICDGVHHAHRHGVTHTDLKPENVLYTTVDGTLVPKVTDWGLANVLLEHSTSVQGMTPAYAAPEQIDPQQYGGTDDRTDIYQLGVIAYELLTGRRPFEHDTYSATMNAILNETPTPPATIDDSVDSALSEIVTRALAKDKDHRYETALHFRDALRQYYHNR